MKAEQRKEQVAKFESESYRIHLGFKRGIYGQAVWLDKLNELVKHFQQVKNSADYVTH